ncbi:MAG: hypothetical protein N2170_02410 [Bacteroidia bacterium]|nr:hypothetical protein [Bacteroidia bacterium]
MKKGWFLLHTCLWAQSTVFVEGGIGGVHRIPVAKSRAWQDIGRSTNAPRRLPGWHMHIGSFLRVYPASSYFFEVGAVGRGFSLETDKQKESFSMVSFPLRLGARIDSSAHPWWGWVGMSASLLLRAQSRPDSAVVYRFSDYFARSQLHLQAGSEKAIGQKWIVGLAAGWDLTPAWDKVLFQAHRCLIHHLTLSTYVRYAVWKAH